MSTIFKRPIEDTSVEDQEVHLQILGLFRVGGESAVIGQLNLGMIWATAEGEDQALFGSKGIKRKLRADDLPAETIDPSDPCLRN